MAPLPWPLRLAVAGLSWRSGRAAVVRRESAEPFQSSSSLAELGSSVGGTSGANASLELGVSSSALQCLLTFDVNYDACGDYSGVRRGVDCPPGRSDRLERGCKRGEGCLQLLSNSNAEYSVKIPCLSISGDWSYTAWLRTQDHSKSQTVFFYGKTYPGDYQYMCEVKYDEDNKINCEEAPLNPAKAAAASLAETSEIPSPRRSVPVSSADADFPHQADSQQSNSVVKGDGLAVEAIEKGSREGVVNGGPAVTTGWFHLALTRSKATGALKIYWNGKLKSELQTNTADVPSQAGHEIFIGGLPGQIGRDFDGTVDEVTVWTRMLSTREVRSIYSQTSAFTSSAMNSVIGKLQVLLDFEDFGNDPVDNSGNFFPVRLEGLNTGAERNNAAEWRTTGCMRGVACVALKGKSGAKALQVPCLKLVEDWSFTAWLNPATTDRDMNIFFFGSKYKESYGFYCNANYADQSLGCGGPKKFGSLKSSSANIVMNADQWHHFGVTREASTGVVSLYWDGQRVGSKTLGTGLMPRSREPGKYGAETFLIGERQGDLETAFEGIVDEVSVWTRVLSAREILNLRGSLAPFG